MPRKYRLSGEEIRKLSGKPALPAGRRVHGRFFSLVVVPIPGTHAKCAGVVSKKVARLAVERNKIKRRCRAVLSKRVSRIGKPVALIFYAKRETKGAEFIEIERDIETLLSRL
jgi:ribonuclease P protein component